jgi:hypothetical protein
MLNSSQVYGVSGGVSASAALIAVFVILRSSRLSRNVKIASSVGAVAACSLVFALSSYGVIQSRPADAPPAEAPSAEGSDDTDEDEEQTCTAGKVQCDGYEDEIYCNENCEAKYKKGGRRLPDCDSVCS